MGEDNDVEVHKKIKRPMVMIRKLTVINIATKCTSPVFQRYECWYSSGHIILEDQLFWSP